MARAALKTTRKITGKTTKAGRPAAAKPTKKPSTVKAPMVSKEELRSLLEKAQAANITLRAKNRDATRAAKTTAAEIMELTAQIVKLEKKLSTQTKKLEKPEAAPVKRGRKAAPKAAEPEVAPETTEI